MKTYNFLSLLIIALLIGIILYFLFNMSYNVIPFRYSVNAIEAEKEKTLVNKYFVYDVGKKQISEAWLEYARGYNIFNKKKIDNNRMLLRVKEAKEFEEIKDVYWEAFFKNKKLTAFEDKRIISVVGVDKSMDTIILKPNKDETFYIVKE